MQITEPVTMLTDYALAAASLYFAFLLARTLGPRNRVSAWLWCAAFLTSAVAALLGGIYHGFASHFDTGALRSIWNVAVFVMGLSCGCMVGGIHAAYMQREDGSVILQVLDTGCGLRSREPTEMFGRGLGLSNIRDRLAHLYGNSQQFSIANRTGGGAQVTLRVPLHISNQPKQAVE